LHYCFDKSKGGAGRLERVWSKLSSLGIAFEGNPLLVVPPAPELVMQLLLGHAAHGNSGAIPGATLAKACDDNSIATPLGWSSAGESSGSEDASSGWGGGEGKEEKQTGGGGKEEAGPARLRRASQLQRMVNAVDGWGAGVIVYALRYEHYSCAKQLLALKEVTLGSSKKKKSVLQIAMAAYIKVKAQQNLLLLIGDMGAKHNKDSSTLTNDNSRGPALPSFSALSLINSASGRKENKQKQQEQEEQKNKTVEEHGAKLSQNGHGKKEATQEEMPPVIRVGVGEASISSREDEVAMCLDLVLTAFCLEVGMPCRRAVDSADACNTPLHERKALSPTKMAKALPLICTCSHQEIRAKLLHMIGCEQVHISHADF